VRIIIHYINQRKSNIKSSIKINRHQSDHKSFIATATCIYQ